MVVASKIVLSYEPQYVGHCDAEERRKAVSEWLREREREVDSTPPRPWCPTQQGLARRNSLMQQSAAAR